MDREQIRVDLEKVAQKQALSAEETMADVLGRLDSVAKQGGIPERLKHYLSQRSYLKALEWLDHPETPHYV